MPEAHSTSQLTHQEHTRVATFDKDRPATSDDRHADRHAGHDVAQFRRRFSRNLLLAVPVVVFSEMFSDLLGYGLPSGTAWVSPVFEIVIFV